MVLLDRHSRGVEPTPAGAVLNRYAADIMGMLAEARDAMRPFKGAAQEQVAFGITPSIMRLVGDDILVDLARMLPGVRLRVVEEFSFVLMRLLEQGELGCVLTFATEIDPRFARRPLLEEELYYLTAPALTPDGPTVTFREVLEGELALTGRQDAVSRLVEEIAGPLGMALTISYEVQSIRAVKNLVAKGIAATIMPYGAAEGELRSGVLRARLITEPNVVRTLNFAYARDQGALYDTPSFRAFVDAVADRLHAAQGPITRRL